MLSHSRIICKRRNMKMPPVSKSFNGSSCGGAGADLLREAFQLTGLQWRIRLSGPSGPSSP